MAQLNDHIKQVMGIKNKPKYKKDYTRTILWTGMVICTAILWTIIYNLIF
jgi:hypothetical protein